jgi:hypothetical protein
MFIASAMTLTSAHGQWETEAVDGIELGDKFVLRPRTEARGAYDNRVIRSVTGGAEGDFYGELAAAAELVNKPARYDLRALARYGYRSHAEYNGLNDDFYTVAASLGTDAGPLLWKLSSDYAKSLDYNTLYNPGAGQEPDSVLAQGSKRSLTRADVSYDSKRFSKTALIPRYAFQHYYREELSIDDTDEWQIHDASLRLRHQYSARTRLAVGGSWALQARDEEDGYIATVGVGAEHRMTAKTSWTVQLGYAFADYELSGADQGVVSNLRGNWRITPKTTVYVFGGNNFQPGYSGSSARMVYRLGYGAAWQAVKRFGLRAAVLHDYQEEIGDNASGGNEYGTVRNFIDFNAEYRPVDPLSLIAGIRVNDDEFDPAQSVISLKAVYSFY